MRLLEVFYLVYLYLLPPNTKVFVYPVLSSQGIFFEGLRAKLVS